MGPPLPVLGTPLRTWRMLLNPAVFSARNQSHQATQYKKGKDSCSAGEKWRYSRKQPMCGQPKPMWYIKAEDTMETELYMSVWLVRDAGIWNGRRQKRKQEVILFQLDFVMKTKNHELVKKKKSLQ